LDLLSIDDEIVGSWLSWDSSQPEDPVAVFWCDTPGQKRSVAAEFV